MITHKTKGKKLLVVDDSATLAKKLKLYFEDRLEIHEINHPVEALNRTVLLQPHAILCNLNSPNIGGIEFCSAVKKSIHCSHIPFLFLTGQANEDSEFLGYAEGADLCLQKPVKIELLVMIIANMIGNHEKLQKKVINTLFQNNSLVIADKTLNCAEQEFIQHISSYIETRIEDTTLDVKAICDTMGISRTVLYAKIKLLTGETVHGLIKKIRLSKSARLLLEGRFSISQVVYQTGFNSHSYFNKCFIHQYGIAPKNYIKKNRFSLLPLLKEP